MEITGSVRKRFYFPASKEVAYKYLSDIPNMMSLFETVTLKEERQMPTGEPAYRLEYSSKEMGVYLVTVICDAFLTLEPDFSELSLVPLDLSKTPFDKFEPVVESQSALALGTFTLKVGFEEEEPEKTIVDYQLSIKTSLKLGGFMVFMPKSLIERLVAPLASDRLKDVVGRFIVDAVTTYRNSTQ